jgi:hypothetical protein
LRREGAVARREQNGRDVEDEAAMGMHRPASVAALLDRFDPLLQMNRHVERFALRHQPLDQFARGARRNGGDVVNRLVGIQFGALATDLVERIHDLARQAEHARLESREEARGTGADNQHIGADRR